MKKALMMVISALVISSSAMAIEPFAAEDLLEATRTAMDTFAAANPSHVQHVSGFKTWRSGRDAKVKVYVSHDGMTMEFNYGCTRQGTLVRCASQ